MADPEILDRTDSDAAARYALAVVAPAVGLLLTLLSRPLLVYPPSVFMFAAVVACAWYGGFGPAVLSALLGALTLEYFVMLPAFGWAGLESIERVSTFAGAGLLVATIGGLQRRRQRALTTLAAIVTSSNDAVIGQTLDGMIVSWNPAAERLYGYSFEEVRGRSIGVIFPLERTGELENILNRIARGERIEHYQTVRLAKDGRRLEIDLMVSPIRDAAGVICGVSATARSLTESKRPGQEHRTPAAVREREPAVR